MFEKILTLFTLAAAIGLSLLLQSTTPTESGPITILTILFFVYVICTGILTWIIVMLLGLRSIGASSFPEVLPVLIFVAIGVFYTRKRID